MRDPRVRRPHAHLEVEKYDPAEKDPVVGRVAREVVTTTVTTSKMHIDDLPLHRSGVAFEA